MRISDWSSDVCSSDLEHGLKMVQTARDRGVPVRALADEMSGYFQDMAAKLNISHDRFIRTVEPDHHAATQALWQRMAAAGDLYLDRYEGWYSVRDEALDRKSTRLNSRH